MAIWLGTTWLRGNKAQEVKLEKLSNQGSLSGAFFIALDLN